MNENFKAWIAALRSGDYRQGRSALVSRATDGPTTIEWRACGADNGDLVPDACQWRETRKNAERDGESLIACMKPPWDRVWIESRRVSQPRKVSDLRAPFDEQEAK